MAGRVHEAREDGPRVLTVDASDKVMPSPERPITNEDAALIDIIRQSPELPSAIIELSRMLRDPAANIRRVVELISTDPVLSAKVLRVVNSAAYGQSRITSLQQAVVLLGFNNIWLLVTQMLASSSIKPFAQLEKKEMRSLWRHAAAASVCARHLLFSFGLTTSEIAPTVFTCSLLHDVGKFLLRGLGGGDENQEEESNTPCARFSVLEEAGIYGLDHCRMGYLLSTYWKLPELICTTIGYHHHPSFGNWQDIPKHAAKTVALVAISDLMAKHAGYWDDSPCCFDVPARPLKQLGLDKTWSINKLLTKELKRDLQQTEALIAAAAEQM
jgi:HD-like signal output (HDOD) protein